MRKAPELLVQQAPKAQVRPSLMIPGVEIIPGLRDTDHFDLPKIPPPGTRASYNSVPISQPYIAITFDDGPHVTNTPRLLDILAERNIKATFFVVGKMVREYPAIVRRILAEGHEIGNHTWDHKPLSSLGPDAIRQELSKTHDAVLKAAGYQMRLLRPPYGASNMRVKQIAYQEFGYPSIIWTVDPLDWKQPGSAIVAQHIVAGTHPGAIILAHDIHAATIDAMPDTLDVLLAKGYHFVTVSQLLHLGEKFPPPAPVPSVPIPAAIPVNDDGTPMVTTKVPAPVVAPAAPKVQPATTIRPAQPVLPVARPGTPAPGGPIHPLTEMPEIRPALPSVGTPQQ